MLRTIGLAAALVVGMGQPGMAADKKFVSFGLSNKKPAVSVTQLVGGYSEAEIVRFISRYCAGAVGPLEAKGKPRKKRGNLLQKYTSSCQGGINQSVVAASNLAVQVQAMENGKTMYEYTIGLNGNISFKREIR